MNVFNPQLVTPPGVQPLPTLEQAAPMPQEMIPSVPVMPPAPPVPPQTVYVPVMVTKPKRQKGMQVSAEVSRKAQGIYPVEQMQKQQLINNAKTPPTPTGAWGASQ